MVREWRPPERMPATSWLARRSTIATSTPANASSPANIRPVGPPPAITTACSVIGTLRLASPLARLTPRFRQILASAGDSARRPGSCRKPPRALYVESGGAVGPPFLCVDLPLVRLARMRGRIPQGQPPPAHVQPPPELEPGHGVLRDAAKTQALVQRNARVV